MTADGNEPVFPRAIARGRGHVESYFVKLNSPDGARALWLRWTVFAAPGEAPRAECWAIAFERGRAPRAVKRSRPLDARVAVREPFVLDWDVATFDGARARGALDGGAVRVRWDLALEARLPPLRPLPFAWMYRAPFPESKLVSPVPDAVARGRYVVDGEEVVVDGWRAMQGHNWGARNAHRYAWCHAAGFDDAEGDAVFEGFSARLSKGGLELPWLTLAFLWVDGAWLRFDAPRAMAAARVRASVLRWSFETKGPGGCVLRGEAEARPEEAAGLHYANPRAPMTYCLNSKLATLRLALTRGGVTRELRTNRAALELGWPTADHGVAMVA